MGTVALVTLIAAGVAFKRIAWRGRVFSQNLVMVALAALQMFILVVHCFFIRSPQLLFCEKYVRGIQIVLACLLYGNLAAELLDRKAAVSCDAKCETRKLSFTCSFICFWFP